ncbi:hypothetical protein SLEP1_g3229 [Rubroshorea leprosula]|uniref:Uncharacterized protein n=1 Tax=Rubroshorea leprosula TaxID=152421 RepID=A0AAV5HR57_9ROSI|nr:hypothetical protein SLEP1_g3229 [Rubroshorea leprosula]
MCIYMASYTNRISTKDILLARELLHDEVETVCGFCRSSVRMLSIFSLIVHLHIVYGQNVYSGGDYLMLCTLNSRKHLCNKCGVRVIGFAMVWTLVGKERTNF